MMYRFLRFVLDSSIRKTKHYNEWYKCPANYTRILENELTEKALALIKEDRILDIGSPKWLSFKLLCCGYRKLHISDVDDYFLKDFQVYKKINPAIELDVFNAESIPYDDNFFNKIFSISVLEHIPNDGDIKVLKEIKRVLVSGGVAVIAIPSSTAYVEEWIENKTFYWNAIQNANGRFFYQKRYDENTIVERFSMDGLTISSIEYIAEKPIREPYFSENGMLMHNAYMVEDMPIARFIKLIDNRFIPLTTYFYYKYYSNKYKYITIDETDPNIRQAVIKFIKS